MDSLYLSLPSSLQNLAISLLGYKTYNQRFGKINNPVYERIKSPYDWDPTLSEQSQRLIDLLTHAVATVPFYTNHFKTHGYSINSVTAENFSSYFPIVEKSDILADPTSFQTTSQSYLKKSFSLFTSGSSGTPLEIKVNKDSRQLNYLFYERLLNHCKLTYQSKSTTFAGRILYREVGNTAARYDYWNKTQYLSSYQLSPSSISKYASAINSWQPEFIDSYPSALSEFIDLMTAENLTINFKPKLILTSSETLTAAVREKITTFFNAPIVDHYGCTEMAVSAYSKEGKYYVHPLYSHLELDNIEGDMHSVITTGLLNFTMPLIRYRIGDTVRSSTPNDPYIFDAVEGRLDDIIVTPEGKRIGRLDPAFKGISGVKKSQIVQYSPNKIEVKITLDPKSSANFKEELLLDNLKTRTSASIEFQFSYHDTLPVEKNGKFKSVISHLNKS